MPEAFELFRALSERALSTAKRPPVLVEVTPMIGRGWMLSYELADGSERVLINALVDAGPPATVDYSYRTPATDSPRRVHLQRVGRLLCLALERARLWPIPAAPVALVEAEPLGIYLAGMCDRGCVFCSRSLYTQREVDAINAELERAKRRAQRSDTGNTRLPVVPSAPSSGHGMYPAEVEAELRSHRPERTTVSWSGLDCIASPFFDDSLRLAHELGYRNMRIQTPGSRLVEPGFIDFLVAHGVTDVSLTAHARDEATFDRMGGKVGAYRMFWEAVTALRERGITLRYEVPCVADTVDDLPEHLAELTKLTELPGAVTVFFWYPEKTMEHRFASLGLPMGRLIDALDRGRAFLPPGRVGVDGLPRCVVPPRLAEHYSWNYGHMSFIGECERLEICAPCALRDSCPGAAPIYLAHHPWPAHAQPVG